MELLSCAILQGNVLLLFITFPESNLRQHPSQAGYAEEAARLVQDYESRTFEQTFASILDLFPASPCRSLDVGAGTGRHAAALAKRNHEVTAVEPTRELREAGQNLHNDVPLTWVNDTLPELESLGHGPKIVQYDFILMAAVLMHFDERERKDIIRRMGELLAPGGRFILSLRHGPIPQGRRMFSVSLDEIITLAKQNGMHYVHHASCPDPSARPGVSWGMLCLDKPTDD